MTRPRPVRAGLAAAAALALLVVLVPRVVLFALAYAAYWVWAKMPAKLGSLAEKMARVGKLADTLAGVVGADTGKVSRAAHLAKADLVSEMVCEFPEVQGVMGQYYARNDGEDDAVAKAIAEHYSPVGPSDECPTDPVSVAVALADKIGFRGLCTSARPICEKCR